MVLEDQKEKLQPQELFVGKLVKVKKEREMKENEKEKEKEKEKESEINN